MSNSTLLVMDNQEETFMSVQSHINELVRKHGEIEKKIAETTLHPSADPLEIAQLKRKKLLLKDEIERMKTATRH
jgi:hypothetical protein